MVEAYISTSKKKRDSLLIRHFGEHADPNNNKRVDQHEIDGLNRYILDPEKTGKITPDNAKKAIKTLIHIEEKVNGEKLVAYDLFKDKSEATEIMTYILKRGIIPKEKNDQPLLFNDVSDEAVEAAVKALYKDVPLPDNNNKKNYPIQSKPTHGLPSQESMGR